MSIAFWGSRYQHSNGESGDYINCPLDETEYNDFVQNLLAADRIPLREFESDITSGVRAGTHRYFESCLPVEILADRGHDALAFGPMRPVGLRDPRSDQRPHAVVQLRQDNLAAEHYSLVGFQTQLKWPEQQRVLRLIPGLEKAEFVRFGMIHRNTYINGPTVLLRTWQSKKRPKLFFAGQLSGVEGYVESAASGLVAGINAAALALGERPRELPRTTALGALSYYVSHADSLNYQPTNIALSLIHI